jgi:polyketide biosynthesis acyl carrier protein
MTQLPDLTRGDVAALVHQTIATILPGVPAERITADKHLKDIGADSVDRVEIILALMDRLGVDRPMSSFSRIADIGGLVDYLWEATRS